jgi:hypothetical protein
VLVKDIYNNSELLLQAGVKETRIKGVMDEGVQTGVYTSFGHR